VALVIDDALLLMVLAGSPTFELAEAMRAGELFTTSSWYYRLGRAAHDRSFLGALSRATEALPAERQAGVATALDALPDEIGLPDMRELVPVMRRLEAGRLVNFLTAEAVALGLVLGGGLRVTTRSPLLEGACRALGIDVVVVEL